MRKQPGFTLIELMVVMAIIAILATAGISGYGGYIKNTRDSTRIIDIGAIEGVILGSLNVNGTAPDIATLRTSIQAMNNGQLVKDPLYDSVIGEKSVCLNAAKALRSCGYRYTSCNNGGYLLRTKFESESNIAKYAATMDKLNTDNVGLNSADDYDVGNCDSYASAPTGI